MTADILLLDILLKPDSRLLELEALLLPCFETSIETAAYPAEDPWPFSHTPSV